MGVAEGCGIVDRMTRGSRRFNWDEGVGSTAMRKARRRPTQEARDGRAKPLHDTTFTLQPYRLSRIKKCSLKSNTSYHFSSAITR